MKSNVETYKRKFYQAVVNITLTLDMKLSADDDDDAKYLAEDILNDLIANEEITVDYAQITDVDVEVDGEIAKEEFDAAPGKLDLHLSSYFKLN